MADLASLNAHTSAVVDVLDAELKTFDGGAPENPGGQGWGWQDTPGGSTFKAYYVVYPLPGGVFDGPLGCPDDDASLIFQVTCVGSTRPQCEAAADRALSLLVGQPLTIAGRYVTRVQADMAQGGARRDDTVQPPVFIATPRFRVDSVPLGGGS